MWQLANQLTDNTDRKHLLIKAVAGAGKTTTLVSICNQIPLNQKVLVVCFNKHISLDLAKKVPSNCKVQTLNSLGYEIIRDNGLRPKIDSWKTSNIFKEINPKLHKQYFGVMNQVISLQKADYDGSWIYPAVYMPTAEEIADKYDISLPKDRLPYAAVFDASVTDNKIIDFDDQLFYPIFYNMGTPSYDWILVDEAQDLSIVQTTLLLKLVKNSKHRATKIVAVGDPSQSIYAFRGAAIGSMDTLQQQLSADILPLSVCYRCPKSVVRYAKTIYPILEEYEGQIEGGVSRIKEQDFNPQIGDTILCRTNAPLMEWCLYLLRQKKLAMIKGDDLRKQLDKVLKKVSTLAELTAYEKGVNWEKKGRAATILLRDQLAVVRYLIKYSEEEDIPVAELLASIFAESKRPHILLSSIHKAKGLEWDCVYIIRPDLLPHPFGDPDQEKNIAYVAVTRAKKQLVFVDKETQV